MHVSCPCAKDKKGPSALKQHVKWTLKVICTLLCLFKARYIYLTLRLTHEITIVSKSNLPVLYTRVDSLHCNWTLLATDLATAEHVNIELAWFTLATFSVRAESAVLLLGRPITIYYVLINFFDGQETIDAWSSCNSPPGVPSGHLLVKILHTTPALAHELECIS